jgi:hypothetical protein
LLAAAWEPVSFVCPALARHDVPRQKHLIDLRKAPAIINAVEYPNQIEALCRPFFRDALEVARNLPGYAGDWFMAPTNQGRIRDTEDCVHKRSIIAPGKFVAHRDSERSRKRRNGVEGT